MRNFAASVSDYDAPHCGIDIAALVDSWTVDQVVIWMRGLDDGVLPVLDRIARSRIDGKALFLIDCDDLERIGIKSYGVRKIIIQSIKVLYRFCYTIQTENLQTLAMSVSLSAREAINDMKACQMQFEKLRNKNPTRSDLVVEFNSIRKAVSRINEDIKRLIHWLDRSPFERKEKFIDLRNKIRKMAFDIVKCATVPTRELIQAPAILLEKAVELCDLCQSIINLEDPAILYTSFIKEAVLKKTTSSDWGFNLISTYNGVHTISEVKVQTPADNCGKLDAGDEIVQVNGVTVIGWELSKLVQKIYDSPMEMRLIVNKRPSEVVPNPFRSCTPATPKALRSTPGAKLTRLGSTKPNPGNLTAKADFSFFSGNDFFEELIKSPKWIRKTASLENVPYLFDWSQASPSQVADENQPPLILRRGSLFRDRGRRAGHGASERVRSGKSIKDPKFVKFDDVVADFHVLYPPKLSFRRSVKSRDSDGSGTPIIATRQHVSLDESVVSPNSETNGDDVLDEKDEEEDSAHQPPLIVRRTRRMRQQPDGYVKSFIDNRLVDEIEENAVLDSVRKNEGEEAGGIQFATIEVVADDELEKLGIPLPPATPLSGGGFRSRLPSDWKAPIRELVTATAGFIGSSSKHTHNSLTSLESPMCSSSHSRVTRFFAEPLPSTPSSPPPTPLKSPFAMSNSVISEDVSISSCSTSRTRAERRAPLADTEETQNIDDWTTTSNTDDEMTNRRIRSTVSAPPEDNEGRGLSLHEIAQISCELLGGKRHEGWVRRMRLDSERNRSKKRKWVKCWLVLKSSLLFIYQNQFANEADIVLSIVNFSVNDTIDIKTSKKHVFKLHRGSTAFYFASFSSADMKTWMNKLALASICYNQSDDEKKSSDFMSKSILYINNALDDVPPTPPAHNVHHTLPRANNSLGGLRARFGERQGSLSSHSARSTLDSELLAALESSLARKRESTIKKDK